MASSETPGWLSSSNDTNNNAAGGDMNNYEMTSGVTPEPAAAATTSNGGGGGGTDITTAPVADENDLPGVILFMRLANMGVAVLIVTASVLVMMSIPPPSVFVLAVYGSCGGLLICCLETQLKFLRVIIAVNFGFLFNSGWRFMFYLLLASVTWTYDELLGKIASGCIVGCAFYNAYVLCRYPSYRRIREKIAEEEDKRIEARISKEVRKQAVRQATK